MRNYKSFLSPLFIEYKKWRMDLGTWSDTIEPLLHAFDTHCDRLDDGNGILTQEMVNSWCAKKDTETNNSCRARVNPAMGFLGYLINRGKADISIPALPKWEKCTYIPTVLTHTELERFFYECDHISSMRNHSISGRNRKMVIPVIFRFLFSTGMRPFEVRWLRVKDVDLSTGIVSIERTKRGIQHRIVLHDSMLELAKEFDSHIRSIYPDREYFFPGFSGGCHTAQWLRETFRTLVLKSGGPKRAVPYSFRHNYATENLNRWDGTDSDFFYRFVMLSKSMGHTGLKSTQYYYRKVPKFYELIEEKTGGGMECIIPDLEVDDETFGKG